MLQYVQLITITDGEPTNEPEHKIFQVIKRVKDFMGQTPYGSNAIAFQFAQARANAHKLDIGTFVRVMCAASNC